MSAGFPECSISLKVRCLGCIWPRDPGTFIVFVPSGAKSNRSRETMHENMFGNRSPNLDPHMIRLVIFAPPPPTTPRPGATDHDHGGSRRIVQPQKSAEASQNAFVVSRPISTRLVATDAPCVAMTTRVVLRVELMSFLIELIGAE